MNVASTQHTSGRTDRKTPPQLVFLALRQFGLMMNWWVMVAEKHLNGGIAFQHRALKEPSRALQLRALIARQAIAFHGTRDRGRTMETT